MTFKNISTKVKNNIFTKWKLCARVYLFTHHLKSIFCLFLSFAVAQTVKRLPAMQETWVRSLGQEDALEKEMATHSSTLAWRIPWTKEAGGLQSMESQRVGHNWATSLSLSLLSLFSTDYYLCFVHKEIEAQRS